MTYLGRVLVGVAVFATLGTVSVASATTVTRPATVQRAAVRVDPPTISRVSAEEALATDLFDFLNQYRSRQGQASFAWNDLVAEAARRYAAELARRGTLSHTGLDGSDTGDRLAAVGFDARGWAENLAAGYRSASTVIDGWRTSPGHHANLVADFRYAGVGVAADANGKLYWVLVLAS